jgi:NAD(P)-dependent dehydrogenase (short-subunit alcohol dehydrogenase family)
LGFRIASPAIQLIMTAAMISQLCAPLVLAACVAHAFGHAVSTEEGGSISAATTTTTTVIRYYNDLVESLSLQHGKCVAITGSTSGLGYWAAVATAKKSPSCLIMLNRASSRAALAEEEVKKHAAPGVVVRTITCDLENISSVREAAADVNRIAAKFGGLDVLALNAGVMAQEDVRTGDGFDVTMQTNHLSHFLLTKLLMPSLQAAAKSRHEVRIVTQTSFARGGSPVNASFYMKSPAGTLGGNDTGMERYHQSKLAGIAFSMALHSKFAQTELYSNFKSLSAAPGAAATQIHLPDSWPKWLMDLMKKHVVMSAQDGSCSLLNAMFAESAKSGDFYEPKWLVNGPTTKVISEGVPDKLASLPRSLAGIHDASYCSNPTDDAVWSASEVGLGEKFIIGRHGDDLKGVQPLIV